MSYPDVHITNSCGFTASGTVHYAACSADNFNIGTGSDWSHSRGVCLITEIEAKIYLPTGTVTATPYESSGTSYSQYAIIQNPPGKFAVTRVVNLVQGDRQLAATGLATAAGFYGVQGTDDVEALALKITQQQEQKIESNWPANLARPTVIKSGTLACALRAPKTLGKEPSCVQGTLEEINRNANLGLADQDILAVTKALLTTMVKSQGKIEFAAGTQTCVSGKNLHWGVSAVAEPLENGKDGVLYTFGVSLV